MSVELRHLPLARLDFIKPMLAKLTNSLPTQGNWFYELKLDGYRALVMKKRGTITLFSRRGNELNQRFPALAEAFDFLPDNTIIDGEVVALDDQGRPLFSALQNYSPRLKSIYFYAFDLLVYEGKDLRNLPLSDRRIVLEKYALPGMRDPVRVSSIFHVSAKQLIAAAKKNGLEGIIAKRVDSSYKSGERSGAWLKYKTNKGQELVVGGYKPGPVVFDYLLAGYYEGKDLIFIAKIKNGFTPALRRQVADSFKSLKTALCPFANLPEPQNARRGEAITAEVMKRIRWLKPRLVAHIEFTEWTEGNHLRHSKFIGLRDDKQAMEVTKETG
jgi:DNA ligase D-like protein (predicted ligase)